MPTHYTRAEYERELDITLAGSFPASDPPPWTLGVAAADHVFAATVPAAIDVVIKDGPGVGGTRLSSLAEAIALAATVAVAILIAGVPVLVLVWGVASAMAWLGGGG